MNLRNFISTKFIPIRGVIHRQMKKKINYTETLEDEA